ARGAVKFLLFIFVVAVIAQTLSGKNSGQIAAREKEHPTCISDWMLCKNTAELIDEYEDQPIVGACIVAARETAKYGEPKLPGAAFRNWTFKDDTSFLKVINNGQARDGNVKLVEPEARYQNAFGTYQRVYLTCTYDLYQKRVILIGLDDEKHLQF